MKIGFIGTGKMATAIAKGILDRGIVAADDVCGIDIDPGARQAFATATGVATSADADSILGPVDIVILAVKPQAAKAAVEPIAEHCQGKLVISIAAGLRLSDLCAWFGSKRIVRVMPNTPAMVGRGASAFCGAEGTARNDAENVRLIFEAVGTAVEVTEDKMDAVTALSGSGPAYFFEMIQALTDAGGQCGLDKDTARELAVQTAAGAAEMLNRGLGSPDQLRDAVTSPGGTTAAGLAVMKENNFRKLIADTVRAAHDRSVELGG